MLKHNHKDTWEHPCMYETDSMNMNGREDNAYIHACTINTHSPLYTCQESLNGLGLWYKNLNSFVRCRQHATHARKLQINSGRGHTIGICTHFVRYQRIYERLTKKKDNRKKNIKSHVMFKGQKNHSTNISMPLSYLASK